MSRPSQASPSRRSRASSTPSPASARSSRRRSGERSSSSTIDATRTRRCCAGSAAKRRRSGSCWRTWPTRSRRRSIVRSRTRRVHDTCSSSPGAATRMRSASASSSDRFAIAASTGSSSYPQAATTRISTKNNGPALRSCSSTGRPDISTQTALSRTTSEAPFEAVEHLLAHGHRRIAFLGDLLSISTADERLQGYTQALDRAGIDDGALVRTGLRDSEAAVARRRRAARPRRSADGALHEPEPAHDRRRPGAPERRARTPDRADRLRRRCSRRHRRARRSRSSLRTRKRWARSRPSFSSGDSTATLRRPCTTSCRST